MDFIGVQGDWTPVINSVMDQIKTRFAKEDSEEEQKGSAIRTYK